MIDWYNRTIDLRAQIRQQKEQDICNLVWCRERLLNIVILYHHVLNWMEDSRRFHIQHRSIERFVDVGLSSCLPSVRVQILLRVLTAGTSTLR